MKNILHIKTTIVGIFIMYFSWKYLGQETADRTIFFVLFGVGIVLIFIPDTFISGLKKGLRILLKKEDATK